MSTAGLVFTTFVCSAGALAPLALSASITWIVMPAAESCWAASADLNTCGWQPHRVQQQAKTAGVMGGAAAAGGRGYSVRGRTVR